MIFEPITHRSEAWFERRLGKPTASQFSRIITPAGKPSSQAAAYEAELIAERIFKCPMGKDISGLPAPAHGIATEAVAAKQLEQETGLTLSPGGFMTDDKKRYGASPDRIIVAGNRRELVEIKCPYEIPVQVRALLFGPDEAHRAQVQGQLLISGYNLAHFYSYRSDCPPAYYKIERDETFIAALAALLDDFCSRLDRDEDRARKMGVWGG